MTESNSLEQQNLTPKTIVAILDNYIVGQHDAKRSVAVALRNRWRRMQVRTDLQQEIVPKNIMMIGPTGVGKTEISRRLAKIINAPFIKVEATKFTQIGYVGKDVESIIRDLAQTSYQKCHAEAMVQAQIKAEQNAEEELLRILYPTPDSTDTQTPETRSKTKEKIRQQLRKGELDDKKISIKITPQQATSMQIMGPPGMEEISDNIQEMLKNLNAQQPKIRKMSVKEAKHELQIKHARQLIDEDEVRRTTVEQVEQGGIVFIDEIDKIARSGEIKGDISREGVQRDLLPLIEGTSVQTKCGTIKTDHILFITSGAFHQSKPSDLIAELQGRLPIRVELESLTVEDFKSILSEPKHSLLKQYSALLEADGIILKWQKTAITRIAEIAYQVNEKNENIGARRLHTVLENLLSDIAFNAPDESEPTITITVKMVEDKLQQLAEDQDLSQYIL